MTEVNVVAVQPEVFGPTAFMQEVRPIRNWHEWLQLAESAARFEQKLGLLHVGFDVGLERCEYHEPDYKRHDRLKFYFDVANGWTNANRFRDQGLLWSDEPRYFIGYKNGDRVDRTQSEQRQLLAQKAFDMLTKNYFKPRLSWLEKANYRDRNEQDWMNKFLLDPSFLFMMEFFKPEKWGVSNLTGHDELRPSEQQAVDFLLKLPRIIWSWRAQEIQSYDSAEHKIEKEQRNLAGSRLVCDAMLWSIEVLSALDELQVLEP